MTLTPSLLPPVIHTQYTHRLWIEKSIFWIVNGVRFNPSEHPYICICRGVRWVGCVSPWTRPSRLSVSSSRSTCSGVGGGGCMCFTLNQTPDCQYLPLAPLAVGWEGEGVCVSPWTRPQTVSIFLSLHLQWGWEGRGWEGEVVFHPEPDPRLSVSSSRSTCCVSC